MVLQTVLLWCLLIPALKLSHLDLPVPGGGGPGVDVQCDSDAGGTGGDVHVLARVVAADDGWRRHPGHSHWKVIFLFLVAEATLEIAVHCH